MKIILSPSKNQSLICPLLKGSKTLFNEEKSLKLMKILGDLSEVELGELFKIKDKLLDETYKLYQNKDFEGIRYDPIGCYSGVVFDVIGNREYSVKERHYIDKHLVILSAMFGIIEPGQGIWPYRLDFKTKLKDLNLYKYWQDDILEYFKDEKVIINLASIEFSSLLKPIADKLVNINFREADGRIISYRAKKARGLMADAIVSVMVEKVETLKGFVIDDYRFDELMSDDKNYFYIKGGNA